MTAPLVVNTPDPYENSLVQWAKAKIAAGGDPDTVWSLAQDKAHAYRASLGSKKDDPNATPETAGDRAAGAISAGYQGLTMGAGNKITAGIRTILPEALGGTRGFDFPEALKEQTRVLSDYRSRHPLESAGLELAGSIPTILATGGAASVAPEAGALAKAGQLAKSGAAYGAASGGLSANSLSDIIPDALKGGAVGAVAGPVIGGIGEMLSRGVGSLAKRIPGGSGGGLGETLGAGAVGPEEEAADRLRASLSRGNVDPASANIPQNLPTSMLDVGSAPTQALARQARNVPTSTARTSIDTFLGDRAAAAGQRIEGALTSGTGHAATDVQLPIEDLIAQRSEEAKPLYDAAREYGQIKDPETINQIKTLLKHPTFAKAWQRGQNLVALEGSSVAPATEQAIPKGITPEIWQTLSPKMKAQFVEAMTPTNKAAAAPDLLANLSDEGIKPTVAQIDAWKKGLDATIESSHGSENALARSEARVYRGKLGEILDRVDAEVPAYAQARNNFRGNSELLDAAEQGAKHFSPTTSAEYLKRTLPLLSDGEQEAYRTNALNAAVQKIRTMGANPDLPSAARGTNIVQRLMGTDDAGAKLRMLFPDEGSYQQFLTQMEQEATYPETSKFFRNQSSTAAQQAEGGMSGGTMRDMAMGAAGSNMARLRLLTRGVGKLMGNGMQPQVADAIGRQATLTGPELQAALGKMVRDHAAQIANRARVQSLLGNLVPAQPGNP